jgi:hypothetical protein
MQYYWDHQIKGDEIRRRVSYMGKKRNPYKDLAIKPEGKSYLEDLFVLKRTLRWLKQ